MKVAAVVPAFNEAGTIGEVVGVLRSCPAIDEVIVVDDGSTDSTAAVALSAGARVLQLPENQGKGAAIQAGYEATDAEILLLCDADLVGLRLSHLYDLLQPLLGGTADMTVGVFEGGRPITDLAQVMAPQLSGQRALRREILAQLDDLTDARFGLEVALTRHCKQTGARVVEVVLPDLTQRMKEEKLGLVKGLMARAKMYWEIVKYAQRH